MIDFKPIDLDDKKQYEKYLFEGEGHGCEFSFANRYMWGEQQVAFLQDCAVMFAHFYGKNVYFYPVGRGNKKAALDAIIEDAKERGIPCKISGLIDEDRQEIEELYPDMFQFTYQRDSFDYVYGIDDLTDLKGRKYQKKRNHLHRFHDAYPEYTVEPIGKDNLSRVRQMVEQWYEKRMLENPDSDFRMEQIALDRAFAHYYEMELEGLVLLNGEEILAMTMGSRLSSDTFDVHFEKARWDVDGAYTAINCEFAKCIREKYPEIRFLDREEDMGLEGLRKAKLSYNPHHLVEKCQAYLVEASYED